MSDDLKKRLRDTPNWMRQGFQNWKDNVRTYDRAPFEAADRIEELQARVAELEAANRGLVRLNETTETRAKAAEEKLAKAVEELQFDYDTLGEINPSNYNHDDVCNLNDKSVEVILSIKATLAELTGGNDD